MALRFISKKELACVGGLLILCVVFASVVAAASLSDYHRRIDTARGETDRLFQTIGEGDISLEHGAITKIHDLLPDTEKIEWSGGGIETNNRWLAASLNEFSNQPDKTKRGAILNGISERLLAVSEKIGEIETALSVNRTKDEDKRKLAEILSRLEYQKAQVKEESVFQRWLREFLEWLARVFPRPQISPSTTDGVGSLKFGLQILIYTLVIALVGFLIYKFAPFLTRRFGSKAKNEKKDRVILGERIGADESAEDLFGEAERLARDGNLRGAIRKGYIALLCELSDRKVIGLARHKTNRDYLRDVRKNQRLFENMTGLTGSFERNWYGLRPSETQDWEDFRDRYRQTIGEVRG